MGSRKTLDKKTKTISLVGEEDMSSKSKGGQSPILGSPWEVSTATEDIKNLVVGGFLAPRELLDYQCALGQDVPTLDSGEIVVFIDSFHHRFRVPIHWFIQDLL
jgi:hypothetical protein